MSPFSCRSLEEFARFIVEQCAIFRGKMSTDKIFLGCREHEINLQDLGRTPSGPPGGGAKGRGRASVRGVGGELQSTNQYVPELENFFYSGLIFASLRSHPGHWFDLLTWV